MKKLILFVSLFTSALGFSQATNYPNGSTVANFTVTDTDGNTIDLYTITASGQYVVVDFFFDTCGPCQATQPTFNELYDKYGCNSGDLFCVSINNGTDNNAEVIAYENTYGGSFHHSPAVSSEGGSLDVKNAFGVSAYPTYCLIGPDNKMIQYDIWPISNVGSYEAYFPSGQITAQACSFATINEEGLTEISLFPTPSSTELNINFQAVTNGTAQIEIYSILGAKIETVITDVISGKNTTTIGVANYSAGQYIINIKLEDKVYTEKFSVIK